MPGIVRQPGAPRLFIGEHVVAIDVWLLGTTASSASLDEAVALSR